MKEKKPKKSTPKKINKLDTTLKINGSFEDAMKALTQPVKSKKK